MAIIDTLKLALSALEESVDLVRQDYADDWRHGVPTRTTQLAMMKQLVDDHEKAIRDLEKLISLVDDHQRIRYNRGKENIMSTYSLPDPPKPKFTETIRGVPCITVTEHEHLMHAYALQALAQATQAEVTLLTNMLESAQKEAQRLQKEVDRLQPRADVSDELLHPEDFNVEVIRKQTSGFDPVRTQGVRVTHKPTGISVTCDAARSQHTNRHQALEQLRAILALRPVQVPMTPEQRAEVFRAAEARMVYDINLSWRNAIVEEVESHYGITAQAKKEDGQ